MAVLEIVYRITNSIDQKLYGIGIFVELVQAFDTVDHPILFKRPKLAHLLYMECCMKYCVAILWTENRLYLIIIRFSILVILIAATSFNLV